MATVNSIANLGSVPEVTKERIAEAGSADIVLSVEIADAQHLGIIRTAVEQVLAALAGSAARAVVIHSNKTIESSLASVGGEEAQSPVQFICYTSPRSDIANAVVQTRSEVFRNIGLIAEALNARACAVVASDLTVVTPEWIVRLLQPILEQNYELIAPRYAFGKFDHLVSGSILAPLVRCLYGKRITHPFGPDFGFSVRLLRLLSAVDPSAIKTSLHVSSWLITEAVTKGLRIGEANLGSRHTVPDWRALSGVLAAVLDPLFAETERHAAFWQRVRNSEAIVDFGLPLAEAEPIAPSIEPRKLIESFQLGSRNLLEIWSLVLPPTILVELKRLNRISPEDFRLSDEVWVRIIFDFALAHRLRTINRDHLLRAMTPLYLGWVASYALEVESISPAAAERRLDQLAAAFEADKSYLVSRWRWPDRFNP